MSVTTWAAILLSFGCWNLSGSRAMLERKATMSDAMTSAMLLVSLVWALAAALAWITGGLR